MTQTDDCARRIAEAKARAEAARQRKDEHATAAAPARVVTHDAGAPPAAPAAPAHGSAREWRAPARAGAGVLTARPDVATAHARQTAAEAVLVTRRSLIRSSFWAGLGVTGAGLLLGFLNFFWPRKVVRAGSVVTVPAAQVPAPGAEPKHFQGGRFYLVNLRPGEGVPAPYQLFAPPAKRGGILALSQK